MGRDRLSLSPDQCDHQLYKLRPEGLRLARRAGPHVEIRRRDQEAASSLVQNLAGCVACPAGARRRHAAVDDAGHLRLDGAVAPGGPRQWTGPYPRTDAWTNADLSSS